MSEENVEIVRRLYAAINERDEGGFKLVDPDFEYEEPEHTLTPGVHRGQEEVKQLIKSEHEVWDEYQSEPEEFFEADDQVVVFVRHRARGGVSGVPVEIRIGHLWTLRDGKALRLEVFPEREKALDAAGLSE